MRLVLNVRIVTRGIRSVDELVVGRRGGRVTMEVMWTIVKCRQPTSPRGYDIARCAHCHYFPRSLQDIRNSR
jgi:hypothetical protein